MVEQRLDRVASRRRQRVQRRCGCRRREFLHDVGRHVVPDDEQGGRHDRRRCVLQQIAAEVRLDEVHGRSDRDVVDHGQHRRAVLVRQARQHRGKLGRVQPSDRIDERADVAGRVVEVARDQLGPLLLEVSSVLDGGVVVRCSRRWWRGHASSVPPRRGSG